MSIEDFTRSLTGSARRPVVRMERWYAASPTDLWSALTDQDRVVRWLGGVRRVSNDVFTVEPTGGGSTASATIVRCEQPRRLVLSWRAGGEEPSAVTVMLTPSGDGTLLTLEHRLIDPAHVVRGALWEQSLDALAASVGTAGRGRATPEVDRAQTWRTLRDRTLVIDIDLAASRPTVWRALTTTAGLKTWWWSHWADVEISVDLRPGGRYRFVAPGAKISVEGAYIAIDPERRISFTWEWTDDMGTSRDEACDIRLTDSARGSVLSLRHTGPWGDDASVENYRQGWSFVFSALASTVRAS